MLGIRQVKSGTCFREKKKKKTQGKKRGELSVFADVHLLALGLCCSLTDHEG